MADSIDLQNALASRLAEFVAKRLTSYPEGYAGLRWSPNMSDTDPYADALVIDADEIEYILEIDVTLWKPTPAHASIIRAPRRVETRQPDDRL